MPVFRAYFHLEKQIQGNNDNIQLQCIYYNTIAINSDIMGQKNNTATIII
jgi:hypothetical protein